VHAIGWSASLSGERRRSAEAVALHDMSRHSAEELQKNTTLNTELAGHAEKFSGRIRASMLRE